MADFVFVSSQNFKDFGREGRMFEENPLLITTMLNSNSLTGITSIIWLVGIPILPFLEIFHIKNEK